jgi:hypothetical protein
MVEAKESLKADVAQKIKEHIQSAKICLISDSIFQWPMQNEPTKNQFVDNEGNIWFLTNHEDEKDQLLNTSGNVQLFYSNAGKSQFLNLSGIRVENFQVQIIRNHQLSSGNYTLVKVIPIEVYYWNSSVNDMVPLLLSEN